MKKLTTEDFIKKSKEKHGNKYDYSESEYVDSKTNVKIICPKHGLFLQNPQSHYSGSECPICAKSIRVENRLGNKDNIKQTFIDKANLVHKNKYTYEKIKYVNSQTKVCITCPVHGDFMQTPNDHSQGHGCPKCAGLDKKEYISNINNPEFKDLIIINPKASLGNKIIGSVYAFINKINHKIYIGKTILNINDRFSVHKYNCFNLKYNNYFYRAIRKYSWESFDKYVIFQTEELDNNEGNKKLLDSIICEKEIEFINKFQSNNAMYGYNLTDGGDGVTGYKFSEETKKEMSESRKGNRNPMFGKILDKNPRSIPILQLDKNGNVVKRWSCAVEIHNVLGYSTSRIRDCYNGKCEFYKEYK